jgi:hypothetical protein
MDFERTGGLAVVIPTAVRGLASFVLRGLVMNFHSCWDRLPESTFNTNTTYVLRHLLFSKSLIKKRLVDQRFVRNPVRLGTKSR